MAVGSVGYIGRGEKANVFHSPDGINWSTYRSRPSGLDNIVWSKSLARFVAKGGGNLPFYHSADGIVWSMASSSPEVDRAAFAWSESLQVFVAAIRKLNPTERSVHGTTSEQGSSFNTEPEESFNVPLYHNGFIVYSRDGDTWYLAQLPPLPSHPNVSVGRGGFRGGYFGIMWSDALSRFVVVGSGYDASLSGNCFEDGKTDLPCGYVYYGVYDQALHSKDGIDWNSSLSYMCQLQIIVELYSYCRPQVRKQIADL